MAAVKEDHKEKNHHKYLIIMSSPIKCNYRLVHYCFSVSFGVFIRLDSWIPEGGICKTPHVVSIKRSHWRIRAVHSLILLFATELAIIFILSHWLCYSLVTVLALCHFIGKQGSQSNKFWTILPQNGHWYPHWENEKSYQIWKLVQLKQLHNILLFLIVIQVKEEYGDRERAESTFFHNKPQMNFSTFIVISVSQD